MAEILREKTGKERRRRGNLSKRDPNSVMEVGHDANSDRIARRTMEMAAVAAEKVNNPALSYAEIAEKFGISASAAANWTKAAGFNVRSHVSVADAVEKNGLLIAVADQELAKRVLESDGESSMVKTSDLITLRDSAFKQNQLLGGKPTELIGVKAIIEQIRDKNS